MTVLVVGGGGREHAVCASLKKSGHISRLICAPGNGGISGIAECYQVKASDVDGMVKLAAEEKADFVVVTPDDPLALGMVDALEAVGIPAFGPQKNAAVIESSKVFSKELMVKHGIPTAEHRSFNTAEEAAAYIKSKGAPIVVKADGLALGKGVVVAMSVEEAVEAVNSMMLDGRFGASGARVVIEEYLTGPEVTAMCFTDGETVVPMPSSQDHKRAFDGNRGPNTGGMGAICPSPHYTSETAKRCMDEILLPAVRAMKNEGRTFKGILYAGLMLTEKGPKVIEFNARFGDPETQAILPLLETDILEIFRAVRDGRLSEIDIRWKTSASCCVVLASGGYPEKYGTGHEITLPESTAEGTRLFHAGTEMRDSKYFTSGGRVLGAACVASRLEGAIAGAYELAEKVSFKDMYYRKDIGRV